MDTTTRERGEHAVALASHAPGDVISEVVGSPVYSAHHRFADLQVRVFQTGTMASGALGVSRFYFGLTPMVVVDVIEHPERFQAEIAAKRAYCAEHGIRYVLVKEAFDEEGVRRQLALARTVNRRRPRTTADAKPKRPRTRK